jgi:hypothetical protein
MDVSYCLNNIDEVLPSKKLFVVDFYFGHKSLNVELE